MKINPNGLKKVKIRIFSAIKFLGSPLNPTTGENSLTKLVGRTKKSTITTFYLYAHIACQNVLELSKYFRCTTDPTEFQREKIGIH